MAYQDPLIAKHRAEILKLATQYHIKNLRLFGSRARGDARPDSDVDLLADMENVHYQDFFKFCDALETLLGVEVDVINPAFIKPRAMPYIMSDATPL